MPMMRLVLRCPGCSYKAKVNVNTEELKGNADVAHTKCEGLIQRLEQHLESKPDKCSCEGFDVSLSKIHVFNENGDEDFQIGPLENTSSSSMSIENCSKRSLQFTNRSL